MITVHMDTGRCSLKRMTAKKKKKKKKKGNET